MWKRNDKNKFVARELPYMQRMWKRKDAMKKEKESEIVERELWDHYSELPNPMWYEYKDREKEEDV
jgi:hypothetical protein